MPESKTLLLVENETAAALHEKQLLESGVYHVIHAPDGESALDALDTGRAPVDLILMDICLGSGSDGIQTAREILQAHDLPIIFLCSRDETERVEKTQQVNCYGLVDKNSDPALLLASVKMALKLHAAHQQLRDSEDRCRREIAVSKRIEKALHDSTRRYRDLFDHAVLAIFQAEKSGKLISVNKAFARMFGYASPEEVYEQVQNPNIDLLANPGRVDEIIAMQRHNPDLKTFENLYRRKDGSLFWGRLNMRALANTDGPEQSVEGMIEDITEHKRVQQELQEQRDFATQILTVMGQGLTVTNSEGRFEFVNPAYARLFGHEPKDLIGKSPRDVTFAEDLPALMEQKRLRQAGKTSSYESRLRRADGSIAHVLVTGVPRKPDGPYAGAIAVITDLSEQKRVEEALRWNQTLLRLMSESSPLGFLVIDNRTDEILYFNRRFCQIWGIEHLAEDMQRGALKSNDILPACLPQLVDVAGFVETCKPLQDEHCRDVIEDEIAFTGDRAIRRFSTQIRGEQDEYFGRFYLFEDISARKRSESRVVALLREKELLLKEVHHRIKNNMSSVISLLRMQAAAQADLSSQTALQVASARAQSMMVLYDKLYRSQDFRAISIHEYIPVLLQEIVTMFAKQDVIRIETHIEELTLPPTLVSPLGILLNELTTNAIKYAFPNEQPGLITVTFSQREGRCFLQFTDNGIGLPANLNFENSPGFGMQLVGILVQQLHGTIAIDRQAGASFLIEFALPGPKNLTPALP